MRNLIQLSQNLHDQRQRPLVALIQKQCRGCDADRSFGLPDGLATPTGHLVTGKAGVRSVSGVWGTGNLNVPGPCEVMYGMADLDAVQPHDFRRQPLDIK